jgi:hypothetical protein
MPCVGMRVDMVQFLLCYKASNVEREEVSVVMAFKETNRIPYSSCHLKIEVHPTVRELEARS